MFGTDGLGRPGLALLLFGSRLPITTSELDGVDDGTPRVGRTLLFGAVDARGAAGGSLLVIFDPPAFSITVDGAVERGGGTARDWDASRTGAAVTRGSILEDPFAGAAPDTCGLLRSSTRRPRSRPGAAVEVLPSPPLSESEAAGDPLGGRAETWRVGSTCPGSRGRLTTSVRLSRS